MKKTLFIVLLLFLAGCGSTTVYETPSMETIPEIQADLPIKAETEPEKLYVSVLGEVISPGVYIVDTGSRMFEVLNMAGGITENADLSGINLVEYVEDGMQITVPTATSSYVNNGNAEILTSHDGKVNINTADIEELKTITGIGDTRAAAIIEYREQAGRFNKIEDIMNVSGIKESIFDKIKDEIYVD